MSAALHNFQICYKIHEAAAPLNRTRNENNVRLRTSFQTSPPQGPSMKSNLCSCLRTALIYLFFMFNVLANISSELILRILVRTCRAGFSVVFHTNLRSNGCCGNLLRSQVSRRKQTAASRTTGGPNIDIYKQ